MLIGAALLFVVLVGLLAANSSAFHQLDGASADKHQPFQETNDAALGFSVIGFTLCLIVGAILLSSTDKPIVGSENVPLLAVGLKAN